MEFVFLGENSKYHKACIERKDESLQSEGFDVELYR